MPERPARLSGGKPKAASGRTSVLFVCAGNICRSPLAEGIFLHLASQAKAAHLFRVDSAGTGAWHAGHAPDRRAISAAEKRGVFLPSLARQITVEDFTAFDFILAMDRDNIQNLTLVSPPGATARVQLIRKYDPEASQGAEIGDPYYGDQQDFEEVFLQLEKACRGFLGSVLDPS